MVTIFLMIFLFWSYMRLFDKPLATRVASWFSPCEQTCLCSGSSVDITEVTQQFTMIKTQLDAISKTLESDASSSVAGSVFATTAPTKVALYYFNQLEDQKLPAEQQVNVNSLLPVYRMFPASEDLLIAAIDELLKGNLTAEEQTK